MDYVNRRNQILVPGLPYTTTVKQHGTFYNERITYGLDRDFPQVSWNVYYIPFRKWLKASCHLSMGRLRMVTQLTRVTTRPLELTGHTSRKWRKMRSNITLTSRQHRSFNHLSHLHGRTPLTLRQLLSKRSMTTLEMRPRSRLTSCSSAPMATRTELHSSTQWSTPQERSNEDGERKLKKEALHCWY